MNTNAERIIQLVTPLTEAVELLVLGCTLDDANIYTQTLRNSGMAIHLNTVNTPDELNSILKSLDADIVLVNCDTEEIDFTTAIRQIRRSSPLAAFILLSDDPSAELFFAAETNAQDIIQRQDYAHLIYVVNREQHNMSLKTKLTQMSGELEELRARYNTLTETTSEAVAYIHQGMHIYANPAYLAMFGFEKAEDLEGLPFMDLVASDDRLKFKPVLHKLDQEHTAEQIEIQCASNDGSTFPAVISFAPTIMDGENCTQVIVGNPNAQMSLEQRMDEMVHYDMDTRLFNRKYLLDTIEKELEKAINLEQRLTLMLINISNYEAIKNKYGSEGTETILKGVSEVLRTTTYDTDTLSRFGEHEFAILCTLGSDCEALSKRLANALSRQVFKTANNHLLNIEFVMGIAHSDAPPVKSTHELITHATCARKEALESATPIAVFNEDMASKAAADQGSVNKNIVEMIDYALDKDQLQLVYQPIVSLHGNSREDYSVYVRLLDDTGTPMPPAEFLQEAETAGRMADIDRWVIRNAIESVAQHRAQGNKLNFVITLSSAGIQDDSLLLWICDCLREFKAKGSWLTFSVPQEDVIRQLDKMEQLTQGLRQINCRVALTHFPFEQESINVMRHLSSDMVCFLPETAKNIVKDKEQEALLKNFNEQLHKEGVKTIITHIEEASQLTILWNLGVDFIQGNFIQAPVDSIIYDAEL